jgi:hypothetical protein
LHRSQTWRSCGGMIRLQSILASGAQGANADEGCCMAYAIAVQSTVARRVVVSCFEDQKPDVEESVTTPSSIAASFSSPPGYASPLRPSAPPQYALHPRYPLRHLDLRAAVPSLGRCPWQTVGTVPERPPSLPNTYYFPRSQRVWCFRSDVLCWWIL